MGILQSSCRAIKDEEEEDEEEDEIPIYPDLQNHYISSEDSSPKLLKLSILIYKTLKGLLRKIGSIYKAIKGLVQKLCVVFNYLKPRKEADPLIPIQNQASTALGEPLLPRICSRRAIEDSSSHSVLTITFGTITDSSGVDCENERDSAPEIRPRICSRTATEDSSLHSVLTITFGTITDSSGVDCESERHSAPEIRCSNGEIAEEIAQQSSACVGLINSREEVKEHVKRSSIVVNEEKRIKHYSSRHKILLVGEGDFSFSACLAVAFGSAPNIIATSLNSQAFLKKHYRNAMSNIAELKSRGSKVMHGIDATEIAKHELLRQLKFDRIIFNFPYAGFFPLESTECQLRRHRKLVSQFVMNAKQMIRKNGEIHILHNTNCMHAESKLESIASSHGLRLIEAVEFKCGHYPGYNTKYGFGGDKNFNPYPSKTFKFGLIEAVKFKCGHYPGYSLLGSVASDKIMCAAVEENASRNGVALKSAEEETVVVEIKSVIQEIRWIKHYSSGHRILLVGEGNFSFSACLALAFRSAPNIIATSLDSPAFLKEHYGNALSNIEELRSRGSKVMHKINATTMANHQLLAHLKFDRIIFNFPYVGLNGYKNLPRQSQLECHQKLVRQFLENAREMIKKNGEIHITHKTNGFHAEWRLVSLGRGCGLRLIEATKFNNLDYPGYNTKCGFGGNGDFNCNPSKTYKFQL